MPELADLLATFADAAVLVVLMVVFVRLAGLRAFSKMSSYDFAVTVAFGSMLASAIFTEGLTLVKGAVALGSLFLVQWVFGLVRSRSQAVRDAADNRPVILMRDGVLDREALRQTRVTESEVQAKLREANALDLSKVRAVVLETTGDVSVLHGERVDPWLLENVREASAP